MLSAIAGSMSRAGGVTMLSAASDSVMLCATVNAVTMSASWRSDAAEQQQADEKQQVIRTDQDVVDAGRDELARRRRARPGACRRSTRTRVRPPSRIACVSASPFVDVEERLVLRIVREQLQRVTVSAPGRRRERVADLQPQRLPIGNDLDARPRAASAAGRRRRR